MKTEERDKNVRFDILDCVQAMVKRANGELRNHFVLPTEVIDSWFRLEPYADTIPSHRNFPAFAEEIKTNRRANNSSDRSDYFHQLNQFFNGDLNSLLQTIDQELSEIEKQIEISKQKEPDQYGAGRPKLEVPANTGPHQRQKIVANYQAELEKWRRTPQGPIMEKLYKRWEEERIPLFDYNKKLLLFQNEVTIIHQIVVNGLPQMESNKQLTDDDRVYSNNNLSSISDSPQTELVSAANCAAGIADDLTVSKQSYGEFGFKRPDVRWVALLHAYREFAINKANAQEIAEKYGHTSGHYLIQTYNKVSLKNDRVGRQGESARVKKAFVEDIRAVLPYLTENQRIKAEEEIIEIESDTL